MTRVADDVTIPNGMAITEDCGNTHRCRVERQSAPLTTSVGRAASATVTVGAETPDEYPDGIAEDALSTPTSATGTACGARMATNCPTVDLDRVPSPTLSAAGRTPACSSLAGTGTDSSIRAQRVGRAFRHPHRAQKPLTRPRRDPQEIARPDTAAADERPSLVLPQQPRNSTACG
jgi:hypothetical protein